ncbi:hypothetical protein EBU99_10050 [bacterium]|nr:hypothetical protein [bacterium]
MKKLSKSKMSAAFITVGSLVLALMACSRLSAHKPEPQTLAVPQRSSGTGFGLSGETPAGLYRGGLLIWSSEVNSEQIATILNATRETNRKYVALNRYFSSFLEKEILPLKRSIDERRAQFASSKALADARISPIQAQLAASWLAGETTAIKARYSDFDKARVEGIFQTYCDAKILDLATRPFLGQVKFRSRPTPSALCEAYYSGRYFTGESCAESDEGRNYYDCIWNEGVLKTSFGSRLQIRLASRRSGTKVSEPLSLQTFSGLPLVKQALALADVPFCNASEMRRALLAGARYRLLSSGVILGGLICGENSRYEMSFGAGDWDKDLANSSPAFLMDAIEAKQGGSSLPQTFQWISGETATAHPDLALQVQGLAAKIAMFHASVSGCVSDFNSPNDVYFNDSRLSGGLSLQGQCKSFLPPSTSLPDVIVVDESLEAKRLELAGLEHELSGLKGNSCPVAPSCEGVPAGHARCDFLNAQVKKAAAAEALSVASVLVTDFGLSFERSSPTSSTVVVWMNGAAVGVGCVGEEKLGACGSATVNPSLSSALPVQAEVSKNKELVLKMKIDSKQMAAAGVPESIVKQFRTFNDAILELNASSNKMEDLVPYLSGKAFIRADSAAASALAEGSVSYLIENSFDKTLGEFCSVQ